MTKDIDDFAVALATGFAANADFLSSIVQFTNRTRPKGNLITVEGEFAHACYNFAEAMMEESKKRKGE